MVPDDTAIVAFDRRQGIAKHGFQPWYIPADEQYFAAWTKKYGGNVLVGSTTYRTFRAPLPERKNFVLTHQSELIEGAELVHNLESFLEEYHESDLWVIGGAAVFSQVLELGYADELYVTAIDADFKCDQFFPAIPSSFMLTEQSEPQAENGFTFTYKKYVKK